MPYDITVRGADDFGRLARHLKQAGDKDLRRELFRGINRAVKPAKAEVKQTALRDLPEAGGLNKLIARSRITTRTRTSATRPTVFLSGRLSGHDLRSIDRGRLRHPVFGNRNVWVNQDVKPGWWSETLMGRVPSVRREVLKAMDDVARKVARG